MNDDPPRLFDIILRWPQDRPLRLEAYRPQHPTLQPADLVLGDLPTRPTVRLEHRLPFCWLGTVPELQIGPPGDPWYCASTDGRVLARADYPTETRAALTTLGAYLFADTPEAQRARDWSWLYGGDPDQLKDLCTCVYIALTDGPQAAARKEQPHG